MDRREDLALDSRIGWRSALDFDRILVRERLLRFGLDTPCPYLRPNGVGPAQSKGNRAGREEDLVQSQRCGGFDRAARGVPQRLCSLRETLASSGFDRPNNFLSGGKFVRRPTI